MRLPTQILIAVAILAGAGFLWFMSQGGNAEQAGKARPRPTPVVNVVAPRLGTVQETVEAVGTTQAQNSIYVVAEVSGRVTKLALNEGQHVRQGTVLVELDDRQARADLRVAESQRDDAATKFRRAQQLQSSRNISESEVDELRSNLEVAKARVLAAHTLLENHKIVAPFDGIVGLRTISTGAYVQPGDQITTLDAVDQIKLSFSVPERFLGQLVADQAVIARNDAFPEQAFGGRVSQVGTRVDPVSRSLVVESQIDNQNRQLRPGQFMRVELVLNERENALLIPEQSVLTEGDRQYAFVIGDESKAERTLLTLGKRLLGEVEVLKGIEAQDQVIVTGLGRLRSGEVVKIMDDPTAVLSVNGHSSQAVTP